MWHSQNSREEEVNPRNVNFLLKFVEKGTVHGASGQILRYFTEDRDLNLRTHQLLLSYQFAGKKTAANFLFYAASKMFITLCAERFQKTKEQSGYRIWHDMRYCRIRASIIYETVRSKTVDESLLENIIRGSKIYNIPTMKRGRELLASASKVV